MTENVAEVGYDLKIFQDKHGYYVTLGSAKSYFVPHGDEVVLVGQAWAIIRDEDGEPIGLKEISRGEDHAAPAQVA